MSGRAVVAIMILGVLLLGATEWTLGIRARRDLDERAEALGVPRLSRQEAAAIVAQQDKFGLPSRLEHAPERDIARYLRAGTLSDPLPTTPEGMELLLESRAATIDHCLKMTTPELAQGEETVRAEIVVGHYDEVGVV